MKIESLRISQEITFLFYLFIYFFHSVIFRDAIRFSNRLQCSIRTFRRNERESSNTENRIDCNECQPHSFKIYFFFIDTRLSARIRIICVFHHARSTRYIEFNEHRECFSLYVHESWSPLFDVTSWTIRSIRIFRKVILMRQKETEREWKFELHKYIYFRIL